MDFSTISPGNFSQPTLNRLDLLVRQIRLFKYDRPEFVRAVLLFDRLKLDLAHQFYPSTYLPLIEAIEHEISLKYQPISLNSNSSNVTLTENRKH